MSVFNDIIIHLGGKKSIENNAQIIISWIVTSVEQSEHNLSCAYRNIFGNWSIGYIETSGYILPSLMRASIYFNEKKLNTIAKTLGSSLLRFQNHNGSFWQSPTNQNPLVFDSSQVLLGLLSLQKEGLVNYTQLKMSYNWLIGQINEQGRFVDYNYKNNYNPSYYARILWSLKLTEVILKLPSHPSVVLLEKYIRSLRNVNGSFLYASFDGSDTAYSHTIIYTLRGLYEYAMLSGNNEILQEVSDSVNTILHLPGYKRFGLNGDYNKDWKHKTRYICSTGNAQLAILLLKMAKNNILNLNTEDVSILLLPLLNNLNRFNLSKVKGLSSSIPQWAAYQRFRETNWTQKFFLDALLELLEAT